MSAREATHSWLAGAAAARTGDEMSGSALLLAGFALTGSTGEASALLAGITVAAAVGGPVLGALLDRSARPGRLLALALVLYATGLAVVLLGIARLPFALVLAVSVLTGLFGPALSGGWSAQLPRVASGKRLSRATALDAMTFHTASLAGPVAAGCLAEAAGASTAVVASAALIGCAAPAAWRLPADRGPVGTVPSGTVVADLAEGARAIRRNPALARATVSSTVSCSAQGMLTACLPLLGAQALGGAGLGTALLSVAAVSALAANALVARFPGRFSAETVLGVAPLVQAVAPALAATGGPAGLTAALLVVGVAEGPQLTALFSVRHRESPEHLRGQVFTTGASLKITGFAVGAAVAGPLASWSLPGALAATAGTALLAVPAAFLVSPAATSPRSARGPG
ncbi:MFS transporter [Streptomyces sp. NPDC020807]|uniref:MFS transporter n=1 Tax=Streptomyces sp. NPDC020807 TaxID=3155119 RepID=UPI003408CA89